MWLRFSSFIVLVTVSCASTAVARPLQLTNHDRAAIVRSVAWDLFRPGRNYEGKHFILGDTIQPDWLPKIRGYEIVLVTKEQIQSPVSPISYYDISLEPRRKSVHVTVQLFSSDRPKSPEVILEYSYRRVGRKWRGKPVWGMGITYLPRAT